MSTLPATAVTPATDAPSMNATSMLADEGARQRTPDGGAGNELIVLLTRIRRTDVAIAGGKGANLGEMIAGGLPVPPGFVVTTRAWERFVAESGIGDRIATLMAGADPDDPDRLNEASTALRALIANTALPSDLDQAIANAYRALAEATAPAPLRVAARSSATVEDSAQYSFAGMFESFLNIVSASELARRVKDCWASAFGARVLFYRLKQGLASEAPLAVIVQRMVDSEKSGVMFTVDPSATGSNRIVIEAAWGLGEVVVGGLVSPDRYVVPREGRRTVEAHIGHKAFELTRDPATGSTRRVELTEDRASARVLTDAEVRDIAALGMRVEAHYGGAPQDVEFAIDHGEIFLTQTRPITTLAVRPPAAVAPAAAAHTELVRGLGASPGVATGMVRVLSSPAEASKMRAGEVLVTTTTTPDWAPIMRRAAAIVTDAGGMTSHAAIVSRELGIPCVVGTREGTRTLRDGTVVTVDGSSGVVVPGALSPAASAAPVAKPGAPALREAAPVTATRIYVNLAEPERAEAVAQRDVDGVGLLRAEFMLLGALEGTHPRQLMQEGRGDELVARLAEPLRRFARAFHPRPVVYRATDFRSNEFRGLKGGEQFEPQEDNPMIGYRGCYRYVKEPDLFALELRAIAQVRSEYPNLHLMIPFVRTGWELAECRKVIDQSPLASDRHFQLWVMAEVPSVLFWLEEYARHGVTGVSIGSNDLTQLMLGVDRDSAILAPLYDERDRAVMEMIRRIIEECGRLGLTSSICGQAPSVYPEYAEALVRWGIDSISVNPDAIERTRHNVAAAEQKILLGKARSQS